MKGGREGGVLVVLSWKKGKRGESENVTETRRVCCPQTVQAENKKKKKKGGVNTKPPVATTTIRIRIIIKETIFQSVPHTFIQTAFGSSGA